MKITSEGQVLGIRYAYVYNTVTRSSNGRIKESLHNLDATMTPNLIELNTLKYGRALSNEVFRRMMACI